MRDVGSITKSFKECWMIATVDDILLFCDEANQKKYDKNKTTSKSNSNQKLNNKAKRKFILNYLKIK